jgi:hypothetical protein
MMYTSPVALNREQHASLTISPSPAGFRFAAEALTVMIAASEFFDAGRCYPIIFTQTPDNSLMPLVLLGLEKSENLFVDESGKWDAPYIPAFVRRYPFITTDETDGRMTVCFDEAYDGFNLDGGLPLFENGEPTEKAREIQAFLQDFYVRMKQTGEFSSMLLELGLLRQISAQASLEDGRKYDLNGMLVVDEQKLSLLSDSEIVRLFRNGNLALIHAHLLSLRNLGLLVTMKGKKIGRD